MQTIVVIGLPILAANFFCIYRILKVKVQLNNTSYQVF